MEEIKNIAQLFKRKKICVPVIQRDYAQGRKDDAIDSIRSNFISSLIDAATKPDHIMDINYIYGINKPGEEFLPIDGQQRLTSIFLFAWYSCIKGNNTELFCQNVKSFSYMVRTSAEDFFDILQQRDDSGKNLFYLKDFQTYVNHESSSLKNFSWFKFQWKYDNTINGVINYLDSVKEAFVNQTYDWKSISEKILNEYECPISFVYVIQNETNSDNLSEQEKENASYDAENRAAITYINMNERGKVLNDFENLKALMYKKDEAKEFIEKYDNNYINVFMNAVEAKISGLSLAQKVSKMDQFALKFLRYIYNDFNLMDTNHNVEVTYYEWMDLLRNENHQFPKEYFEFLTFVLSEPLNDNEKNIFYDYCNDDRHTSPNRFKFFNTFWEKYKKLSQDPYWPILKKHLRIDEQTNYEIQEYRLLVKLINELSDACNIDPSHKLLNVVCNLDPLSFYHKISENGKKYETVNMNVLHEEKVKASLILWGQNTQKTGCHIEMFEGCGANHRHRIQYLLYITDLWDNACNENKYNLLTEYMKIDQDIQDVFCKQEKDWTETEWNWHKAYYISSLKSTQTVDYALPDDSVSTKWKDDILVWEPGITPTDSQKDHLNRVKDCFEQIKKHGTLDKYISYIVQTIGENAKTWLYYVLNRKYIELFENKTKNENNGYSINIDGNGMYLVNENFYEYVLYRDIKPKVNVVYGSSLLKTEEHSILTQPVSPKTGDGYSRKRNMEIILNINYFLNNRGFYYVSQSSVNLIQFAGFDNNNEDIFYFSQDSSILGTMKSSTDVIVKLVNNLMQQFGDNDFYKWVFNRWTDNLSDSLIKLLLNNQTLDIKSVTCMNEGSNRIIIKIDKILQYNASKSSTMTHKNMLSNL